MAERIRTGLDWEDVRVFLALARHGSLSAAARSLSVNHATVARRIQSLEAALGQRVVARRPDGYVLTPAGTGVLAAARDMEAAAAVLIRGAAGEGLKGRVRINAPPSLSQLFLVPTLARFSALHPGLDIDVATEFRAVSLERRETDVALRFGRPEDGDVIAKRLVTVGFGLYANAACRDRVLNGTDPVLVGFDEANAHLPEARWLSRHFPRARMAFRTTGQAAQAAAARAGAGIALLPHFIAQDDPNLVPCHLGQAPPSREVWLITRNHDREDLAIRSVAEFIKQSFEHERSWFEGCTDESVAEPVRQGRDPSAF